MVLLTGLLINLLFILLLILLANMLLWKKHTSLQIKYRKTHIFLLSSAAIIQCILLSVPIDEHFIYDLRFIPFLLGGLYGGKYVTIGLAITLVSIRIPLGGDGIWLTILLVILFSTIIIKMSDKFFNKHMRWRLAVTTILALGYSIIGFLLPAIYYDFIDFIHYGTYAFILSLSTYFVSYLLEILRTIYVLQLEAVKYEKMEIVSHLAASISHEVRNPLTAVKGFLQLILEDQKIPENIKTYSSLALEETTRASNIINDYLTFAKPHQEKQIVFGIEEEIEKCKEIITPLALKNDVEVYKAFFHSGKIMGDPHKFRQVLLNVCKNAIEAMPNGGTLSILTSSTDTSILIHITDTGYGMSPQHIARLGEPYFSLKDQKGTGLGMMVVFKIVEGMGGAVRVSSEEHVGTTVYLTFPIYKEQ
ncbi:sensor histidine kinase [Bacillus dakarensis]|uniref:ATP-binding protein n=1 Tax=Robertmurraya dakarensis TaxID=1926278 RepID=UPI0009825AAE|nr:sensor histidine kinase [Bacillus dakarensis]